MIIPIVFTLDPVYENLSQTWVFYKALTLIKKNGGAVITQEQYVSQIEKQKNILPQFFQKDVAEMFEYETFGAYEMQKMNLICIPSQIEDRYIQKHGTQSDAYMASLKESWPELEEYLYEKLMAYMKKEGEKPEAFTCLTYLKFVQNVADRLCVPVIYYEWGPFRYSAYRNTAYFDIDAQYKKISEKYEEFVNQGYAQQVPVLSRKEILALFLKQDKLEYLDRMEHTAEKYEAGVAGGYGSLTEASAYTYTNIIEMYNHAKQLFSDEKIAVRYHPGDPVHMRVDARNELQGDLVSFILECKRIICIASNVGFEAMMYGKKVYDSGSIRYQGITNARIKDLEEKEADLNILNFIVFVILVPFEFLNSVSYIRYRLKNPSLKDIYLYHFQYYMNCWGIQPDGGKESIFSLIMQAREKGITKNAPHAFHKHMADTDGDLRVQQYKNQCDFMTQKALQAEAEKEQYKSQSQQLQLETEQHISQIQELEQQVKQLTEKQLQLETEKQNLDTEKRQLSADQQQLECSRQQLQIEKDKLEKQLTIVMHSFSMRITKPLRKLNQYMHFKHRR